MTTVLVTGVGAVIGYGIVRALKRSSRTVRVVGVDIYPDAVGQAWCDEFRPGVLAADPAFPAFLAAVIDEFAVDLVIPGIEQDLTRIASDYAVFAQMPTRFAINRPELVEIFNDKWRSHMYFATAGIARIPTFIQGSFGEVSAVTGLPMLLKPRRSYASKGILRLHTEADFAYWQAKMGDDFMVQRIMGDAHSEFTVAVFGLGDGRFVNLIALQRSLGSDGATAKAQVVRDPAIDDYVTRLCAHAKPLGPTNIQLMRDGGELYLLEVNPRVSSSTSIRSHFGVNEAEMCLEFYLDGQTPAPRQVTLGKVCRYLEDMVSHDRDPR